MAEMPNIRFETAGLAHASSATAAHAPNTEHLPPEAFDPAAWLDSFRNVGGWWVIGSDDRPNIGWMIEGFTDDQHLEARRLWKEVEHDQGRWRAIRDYLLASVGKVS